MPYIQLTYCQKSAGADYAEWIPGSQDAVSQSIVSIDPGKNDRVILSANPYDESVVGIVATRPGWIIGQEDKDGVQLALSGRVPTKVSLINGEIKRGDPITTSSIPGVGMKATEAGPIVGKAMEPLNTESSLVPCNSPSTGEGSFCGTISVFVNVSWYDPGVTRLSVAGADNSDNKVVKTQMFSSDLFTDNATVSGKLLIRENTTPGWLASQKRKSCSADKNGILHCESDKNWDVNTGEFNAVLEVYGDALFTRLQANSISTGKFYADDIITAKGSLNDLLEKTDSIVKSLGGDDYGDIILLSDKVASLSLTVEELMNLTNNQQPTTNDLAIFDFNILFSSIVSKFSKLFEIVFEQGLVRVARIVADMIETKKLAAEELQLKDSQTGNIYCVTIKNGEFDKAQGECGGSTPTPTPEATPETTPEITPEPTPTPESEVTPSPTSMPEPTPEIIPTPSPELSPETNT
jgi:hypothetical protein